MHLLLAAAALQASAAPQPCEGPPVMMVVAGPTHDADRMRAYGKAIFDSGLYRQLGGYYLNVPRAVEVFEGEPAANHTTLIVRFPCLANARAFWNSRVYQEEIRPMRLDPSAGDYLVTVYAETPIPPQMEGKVQPGPYLATFSADGIPQHETPNAAGAEHSLDARTILDRAVATAGGDAWLNPRTLVMRGQATFFGPDGAAPRAVADDYRMWRIYNPDRTVSHGADGMVRIRGLQNGRLMFEVGHDGAQSWNERGPIPQAEADAYWASAFGFGIIRQAGRPGFRLDRVPDSQFAGHPIFKLRLTDPQGGETLFGIDKRSYAIRTMEFATPRGWHLRTYEDFVELPSPRWLQARRVTLYYNGVKQNEVQWTDVEVNAPLDPALFRYPAPDPG
ncbi:MAG: DUF1330 domain-containing protein [Allosphingosinicella sp.]|uniref:DUF1330 domain-containing protein n=1 Tax=Allosphingosinicella sp. TaxID=2823234 RepID=UPI00393152E4